METKTHGKVGKSINVLESNRLRCSGGEALLERIWDARDDFPNDNSQDDGDDENDDDGWQYRTHENRERKG